MAANPRDLELSPGNQRPRHPGLARILVTDDHPEMLRLVDRTLGSDYRCEFAAMVSEAHRKLASAPFELALCDTQMQAGSGLALAEEITEEHPETAVVLVTDRDDPTVAKRAFGLGGHGIHGYLVKPFWPGQLLITVINALRRRELELLERSYSRNLQDRLQTIIERAPLPIYVKDEFLRYVFVNPQGDRLTGLGPGGLIGKSDEAILSASEQARTEAIDREILAGGPSHEEDELTVEVGGIALTFKTFRFALFGEDGQPCGVCGISTDVSAQREALARPTPRA